MFQESRREKKLNNRGNKTLNDSAVDAAEDELGLQGATADDAEAEHVRQVTNSLQFTFKPLFRVL